MKLTSNQAKETFKNPVNKRQIDSVKKLESRLRVFTEDYDFDELVSEPYWTELKSKLQARSAKKADRVLQFARYPLPVVQITDSILSDFYKVYDGKNKHFKINSDRDISLLNEWIIEKNIELFVERTTKQAFKDSPCLFAVIDINDKGVPYLVEVDSSRLIDAAFKGKNKLEYITFWHSFTEEYGKEVKRVAVYDEEYYRVFKLSETEGLVLEREVVHGLNEVPARPVISSVTNKKNLFKRRSAFSKSLSKLEDWTYFDIYRNFNDHFAPFPVTESPKKKCPDSRCENGYIQNVIDNPSDPANAKVEITRCKICEGHDGELILPGTNIGIKVNPDPTKNDGSGIFKMIFPDTDKLKYVPEKLDDLELEIRYKTVGLNHLSSQSEAMNEMQVKGSYSSMENILVRNKRELDQLYIWIVKTTAKLFYKDIDIHVDANFGTEYYLVDEATLQDRIKTAKEAGLPTEEIVSLYKQLIQTKYAGNPSKIERNLTLLELEQYPVLSLKECIELKNEGVLDDFELSYKANFFELIKKFERENIDITLFGSNLKNQEDRVKSIKEALFDYNKELIEDKKKRATPEKTS